MTPAPHERRPLVAGNWKMHTTLPEGVALARIVAATTSNAGGVEVAVLPPFTHLFAVREALRGGSLLVGAQDVYWEDSGAFTGEVSPAMLQGLCDLVLVGHSERRHLFDETDEHVGRKLAAVLRHRLRAIVAVGETESERESGSTFDVVDRQLRAAFAPLSGTPEENAVAIAYEPVWAIGTGRNATPEQAEEVCAHIKDEVQRVAGIEGIAVLYGGSVIASNAGSLFAQPSVDGALVGGASLKPDDFAAIVRSAASANSA